MLCLERRQSTSTLDNLQTAFNGESMAHARYLAFAKKADQEGFGEVASLFRAAAKAEEIMPAITVTGSEKWAQRRA